MTEHQASKQEPPGFFVEVNEPDEDKHRIHYQTFGRGPNKIILLMGVGGTAVQWESQLEFFASKERESIYSVVTVENRGIGLSDSVGGRWTTFKLARDALRVLDNLGWTKDVNVVGVSMGGMIAQELIKQGEPGRFATLTLLSTIAGGLHSIAYFAMCLPTGIQLLVRSALTANPKERLKNALRVQFPEEFLSQLVPHPKDPSKQITNFQVQRYALISRAKRDMARGIPVQFPLSTFIRQVGAVTTHQVTFEQMKAIHLKLSGRILVITGDEDILVHMANSKRLAEGLNAKYVELKGAGHGAFQQMHDKVNQEIENLILNKSNMASSTNSRL